MLVCSGMLTELAVSVYLRAVSALSKSTDT